MIFISGQSALNIPSESEEFVDWHLLQAFGGSFLEWRARCTWVGDIDISGQGRHLPDTRPWLGEVGVWDCTEVLRRHGVEIDAGQRIHAAQPWRAVLDMGKRSAKSSCREGGNGVSAHESTPFQVDTYALRNLN